MGKMRKFWKCLVVMVAHIVNVLSATEVYNFKWLKLVEPMVPLQLPPPLQPQLIQPQLQTDPLGII